MYVCIYIYIYTHVCHIYIYIYTHVSVRMADGAGIRCGRRQKRQKRGNDAPWEGEVLRLDIQRSLIEPRCMMWPPCGLTDINTSMIHIMNLRMQTYTHKQTLS